MFVQFGENSPKLFLRKVFLALNIRDIAVIVKIVQLSLFSKTFCRILCNYFNFRWKIIHISPQKQSYSLIFMTIFAQINFAKTCEQLKVFAFFVSTFRESQNFLVFADVLRIILQIFRCFRKWFCEYAGMNFDNKFAKTLKLNFRFNPSFHCY